MLSSPFDRLRHNDLLPNVPSPSSHSTLDPIFTPPLRWTTSPTCALNGTVCPAPRWPAQWNLTLSTVCQPSTPDYFVPVPSQPWGLISLDWSVAENEWLKPNMNDSTNEATSIEGCRRIKAVSPNTRCFIYHNMELALQALETQRLVMYQPGYANWFLQYQDAAGQKTGRIYNEPGGPGDQFFWDFRVPAVADYVVYSLASTVSSDYVDGTFSDDVDGFPAEHSNGPKNINMSDADVAILQYHTQLTHTRLLAELISRGKYNWQAFGGYDGVGAGISQSTCLAFMRPKCNAAWQVNNAFTMNMDKNYQSQSLAAFLVVRTPVAYLGYGWESDQSDWLPIFLTQVGEPSGVCQEVSTGVFSRQWSYGNVTLNCTSFTATVPHAEGIITTPL